MADLSDDIRSLIEGGIDPVTFDEITQGTRRPRPPRRRTVARVASVVVLVAVAVPVVLAVSNARSTTPTATHGGARHRVLAALSTTIASGSFDITFSQEPVSAPTTSTTTTSTDPCVAVGPGTPESFGKGAAPGGLSESFSCPTTYEPSTGLAISGHGTIDTNPFAMAAVSQVPGLGQISAFDNGTKVWELGGGNYGLAPGSTNSGPGSVLTGFAGLVEGTLGPRQGALDMMGLASPTGYLELDEAAITQADQIGTGTVDGVPVTIYQATLDPDQEVNVPGMNAVQASAIQSALALLKAQGYSGTTVKVSIDGSGYIRQTNLVASVSDGATQTSVTTFSNFGCAGTVLMPGQTGSTTAPAGCVSPDTASTVATP
jgi:hypothetical protein